MAVPRGCRLALRPISAVGEVRAIPGSEAHLSLRDSGVLVLGVSQGQTLHVRGSPVGHGPWPPGYPPRIELALIGVPDV